MGDLLDDQLFISFPMFALPEDTAGVTLHIIDVILCAIVLIISKGDREAGSNFLCIHSDVKFAIVMPVELLLNYRKTRPKVNALPEGGRIRPAVKQARNEEGGTRNEGISETLLFVPRT